MTIKERKSNNGFNKWSTDSSFLFGLLILLSTIDIEAFSFFNSKFAGFKKFDVPLTAITKKLIFWSGFISIFIEDLPHLIIQVILY